jgi:DNA-binding transcriptional regulator YiaG
VVKLAAGFVRTGIPGVFHESQRGEHFMPNLTSVLRDEICRLARKEIRSDVGVTKRQSAQHRRDIAALKRLAESFERRISFLERQEKKRVRTEKPAAPAEGVRFSPKWLKAHRNKIGLSAADYGELIGVSGLTIYNWEQGKAKPRDKSLAALASIRGLGKREALKRLEMLRG